MGDRAHGGAWPVQDRALATPRTPVLAMRGD